MSDWMNLLFYHIETDQSDLFLLVLSGLYSSRVIIGVNEGICSVLHTPKTVWSEVKTPLPPSTASTAAVVTVHLVQKCHEVLLSSTYTHIFLLLFSAWPSTRVDFTSCFCHS